MTEKMFEQEQDARLHQDDTAVPSEAGPDAADETSPSNEDAPSKKKKVWPSKYNKGPFICAYCQKKFRGLLDLTRHERTHTNDKPLVCEECGKAFSGDSTLRCHMDTHRNHRPHPCPTCDMKFRNRSSLRDHMVVHTDLRPFVCKVCGTGMRQKSSLRKHMRIHTGELPYQCEICLRKFRCSATCRLHQERHANPDSRVNRIPKEPRRIRKGGTKKYIPMDVRRKINYNRWRQSRNLLPITQAGPPANAPDINISDVAREIPITGSLGATANNPMTFNHPVTTVTPSSLSVYNTPNNAQIIAKNTSLTSSGIHVSKVTQSDTGISTCRISDNLIGAQVTSVTTNIKQSYTPNIMKPIHVPNGSAALSMQGLDSTNVALNKRGFMSVDALTANSPILVNSEQIVTFQFTPLMVIQTPFGANMTASAIGQ